MELDHVFDKFPNYHMKILLGDFNAKVRREDVFKATIGNESLQEISNDNGVRLVNFATSKTSESKVRCSHIATSINILGRLQMGKPTIRLTTFYQIGEGIRIYLMFDHTGQQIVILTTISWLQI
jgi:hypothetical protein